MPLPAFVNSFAAKAQSAIEQHLPQSQARPGSPDAAGQPTANSAAATTAQGSNAPPAQRSHALGALGHHLKTFKEQYQTTTPVQKIITNEKGVALAFDYATRDSKAQSKELYTWGQTEDEDLKDVTDRLAYFNFIHGSLSAVLSQKLDAARNPLKALRDAELAIGPRRNVRAGLQTQLSKIEHDQARGMEKKVAELKQQIQKAEADDAAQENEIEILKRRGLKESEQLKWDALREYGEKLSLLSQAASQVAQFVPAVPSHANQPYTGTEKTAAARASLQDALDHYKTGLVTLDLPGSGADLSRHDTRSFGQTHAKEIASIDSSPSHSAHGHGQSNLPLTPPAEHPVPGQQLPPSGPTPLVNAAGITSNTSVTIGGGTGINPLALNNAPAPIPSNSNVQLKDAPGSPEVPSNINTDIAVSDSSKPIMNNTPTISETGVPISAGAGGDPGPATGSLRDLRQEKYETAEDEKKRLEREEVERAKKEVEAGVGAPARKETGDGDLESLPAYKEF